MIRAFLAVELTDDLRNQLAQVQQGLKQQLSRGIPKTLRISWVQPASLHLTIKFLGDMEESSIEPLRAAIAQVTEEGRSVQIQLERLGVFPRPQQPRVVWVGPSERWEQGDEAMELASLHRSIEERCQSVGFAPEDRAPSPHLTLARVKEGERDVGRLLAQSGVLDRPLTIGSLQMNTIALMKSDLRPTGPVYTKLWEVGIGQTR